MKVIDLLNKIANREEVPLVLKYNNKIYEYTKEIDWYLREDLKSELFIDKGRLNDEVEIINETEEKKIPEKLDWNKNDFTYPEGNLMSEETADMLMEIQDKVNFILEYLKSKGE